jgi:hypothetical protein
VEDEEEIVDDMNIIKTVPHDPYFSSDSDRDDISGADMNASITPGEGFIFFFFYLNISFSFFFFDVYLCFKKAVFSFFEC